MIAVGYCQHVGQAQFNQQDALLAGHQVFQERELMGSFEQAGPGLLLAVADGVAASPAADKASHLALTLLSEKLAQPQNEAAYPTLTARVVREVQLEMANRLRRRRTHGAACTLAAVQLLGDKAIVLNCGDSRVYKIQGGQEGTAAWRQVSKDHTLRQHFQDAGWLDEDQQYASVYDGLANCLIADSEEADFEIHRTEISVRSGDYFLLTTDGVHDVLKLEGLASNFDSRPDTLGQVNRWCEVVIQAGSPDNFSLILAHVK